MNLDPTLIRATRLPQRAFTLVEVCISVAILAVMVISLYAGMSSSFAITQNSRENLRATQIMLERMEGIRLYNWNQLVYSNNLLPATFTNYYYPLAAPGESRGTVYVGTMVVTNAALTPPATYSTDMRAITVTVYWTNSYNPATPLVHSRSMTTYSARNGEQNYVYSN